MSYENRGINAPMTGPFFVLIGLVVGVLGSLLAWVYLDSGSFWSDSAGDRAVGLAALAMFVIAGIFVGIGVVAIGVNVGMRTWHESTPED
jgi:hypothetical protein